MSLDYLPAIGAARAGRGDSHCCCRSPGVGELNFTRRPTNIPLHPAFSVENLRGNPFHLLALRDRHASDLVGVVPPLGWVRADDQSPGFHRDRIEEDLGHGRRTKGLHESPEDLSYFVRSL